MGTMTGKGRELADMMVCYRKLGRHNMRAGHKVEREQGQEHRIRLQNILPWRG